jgi:hypothetical protein
MPTIRAVTFGDNDGANVLLVAKLLQDPEKLGVVLEAGAPE